MVIVSRIQAHNGNNNMPKTKVFGIVKMYQINLRNYWDFWMHFAHPFLTRPKKEHLLINM